MIKQDGKLYTYTLHAIVVHSGVAYGGHFFNFIKDHKNDKWRKFNDSTVSDVVDKNDVFQTASRSAFWVVYLNDEQLEKAKCYDIYD